MKEYVFPVLAGALTGILSGFGVGGGTLLLIYMTTVAGLGQTLSQGINLLYFLPAAATALPGHFKNGYIETSVAVPAILLGLVGTVLGALIATSLDVGLLRKCFGLFLIYIGITELFGK
ncbi:MAG: Conserved rane protein, predicted permease [Oscillospiraceae bacterium]|nr:Conserved rane protein, predicted permease [Oscillospiraceae bacterium]